MDYMKKRDMPLVWLHTEVKSPPFSLAARIEAGTLLRQLQQGILLALPHSRPMPVIGARCHELRINDESKTWRIFYRADTDAIVLLDVLAKKTDTTPKPTIDLCIARLNVYFTPRRATISREGGLLISRHAGPAISWQGGPV